MAQSRASSPSNLRYGWIGIAIALPSLAGIVYLTYWLPPFGAALPLFFALVFLTVGGLSAPLCAWLEGRLAQRFRWRTSVWRFVRWSAWLGLWGALCAWLQYNGLLYIVSAVLLLLILFLVEWLILSRQR